MPAAASPDPLRRSLPALLVLAVATFAAVTTETAPVGLLPQISAAFGRSESVTGLVVGLYAVVVAITSLPLVVATARVPGRLLLLGSAICYTLSNLGSAAAPSFAALAAARVLGGLTHALFFSVCIGYAARLVPAELTGRALAVASAGASAGFVLGVPATAALGSLVGWRSVFWALTVVTGVTAVLVVRVLPVVRPPRTTGFRRWWPDRTLGAVAGANILAYLGHYTLYTFVTVLLLGAGVANRWISPVLLVFGVLALVTLGRRARGLDRAPRRTGLITLAGVAAGAAACAALYPNLAAVLVAASLWAGSFGPVASFFQSAAVRSREVSPEIAGGWINAGANVGIAGGAGLGGVLLDHGGIRAAAAVAGLLVAGAAVTVATARSAFSAAPVEDGSPT